MNQDLNNYVVFDIETSGLSPESHKIIEIGGFKVADNNIISSFHSLINYKGKLNDDIIQLTGINPIDLKNAPDRKSVLSNFFDFVGDFNLVGHNLIKFDNKFLWFSAISVGLEPLKNGLIDTLSIAREIIPSGISCKLQNLCEIFEIPVGNTHRALDDANLTLQLFQKIKEQFNPVIQPTFKEYESGSPFWRGIDPKYITKKHDIEAKNLTNKIFCITTFLPFGMFNDESDLQQFIIDAGGKIATGVTLKTDYLIDCDPMYVSGKEKKALDFIENNKSNIKIISPDEFLKLADLL